MFNGSLPLADPNLQLNNFNPATGEFGTAEVLESPSWAHPLGTDALARDTFSRAVHGAYVSVIVAVVSVTCGVIVGGILGSLVGFVRGKTETVFMAMIDVLLAFPALVLLLALISIFEVRDLFVISFVIGLLSIPAYMRVSRANSLAISNREFVHGGTGDRHQEADDPVARDHPERDADAACVRDGRCRRCRRGRGLAVVPRAERAAADSRRGAT